MRGCPALKESKLCQWGSVWECPLIDIKGFVPGDVRFHTTSGGWSVLVVLVLWSLSTAANDCFRVSVIAGACSIYSCCQSHSLFSVLVSQRGSAMLSADTLVSVHILELTLQFWMIIFHFKAQCDHGIILCKGWISCGANYLCIHEYSAHIFLFLE